MWRQGDVFIDRVQSIPRSAKVRPNLTLAEGEITGHAHRVADSSTATLYADEDDLYLEVTADTAVITHEEHGSVTLDRGAYRVWRQREYTPEEIRTVRD
ncbi:MAG: hypothetical protein JXQ75_23125 [Phycisphaerae bacterium]|nr:hypothetical protein [Phycisphaerae bacterium]